MGNHVKRQNFFASLDDYPQRISLINQLNPERSDRSGDARTRGGNINESSLCSVIPAARLSFKSLQQDFHKILKIRQERERRE